jgi:hypothetical protein
VGGAVWQGQSRGAAARADNQAFEADLRDLQISVIAELAHNYFELRGAQWRLAVAERSLTNQRETLRLTQLRRDAGVGEEQDVASAAARMAAIDATIPSIEFEISRVSVGSFDSDAARRAECRPPPPKVHHACQGLTHRQSRRAAAAPS